ncbi:MAG TPA: hypothetical protein VFW65_21300 [Pseudonocardiaceae bacterium]|nr:hypothetical protein [Pseudonocardiaceae bacterium]
MSRRDALGRAGLAAATPLVAGAVDRQVEFLEVAATKEYPGGTRC